MQQKIIQVGNNKLLALDMPEDAVKAEVDNGDLFYFTNDNDVAQWAYSKPNMTIIGFKNDITEEQWKEIVPYIERVWGGSYYDYTKPVKNKFLYVGTPKESGLSLLQANNIDYLNCLIIQVI